MGSQSVAAPGRRAPTWPCCPLPGAPLLLEAKDLRLVVLEALGVRVLSVPGLVVQLRDVRDGRGSRSPTGLRLGVRRLDALLLLELALAPWVSSVFCLRPFSPRRPPRAPPPSSRRAQFSRSAWPPSSPPRPARCCRDAPARLERARQQLGVLRRLLRLRLLERPPPQPPSRPWPPARRPWPAGRPRGWRPSPALGLEARVHHHHVVVVDRHACEGRARSTSEGSPTVWGTVVALLLYTRGQLAVTSGAPI